MSEDLRETAHHEAWFAWQEAQHPPEQAPADEQGLLFVAVEAALDVVLGDTVEHHPDREADRAPASGPTAPGLGGGPHGPVAGSGGRDGRVPGQSGSGGVA